MAIQKKVTINAEFEIKTRKISVESSCDRKDELPSSVKHSLLLFNSIENFYNEILVFAFFIVLQIVISTGNYSGYQSSPMYGDFEAQRHWMEITINVPISDWYMETQQNNLTYWGLDYPPLTAYHSWLLGKLSHLIEPRWVTLHTSRGIEEPQHKLFMRISVILTMCTLYAGAIFALFRKNFWHSKKPKHYALLLSVALCYPGLIIIDNGHFQYNHIALGFFLWSVYCFLCRNYYYGSICFVLALNFKQMELYHALPIFVFLLSRLFISKGKPSLAARLILSFYNVIKLGIVVLLTFIILWAPFLTDIRITAQVLRRLFPISRGVFEDKVANFWCCISIVYKVKEKFSNDFLALISASTVFVAILPSLFLLLRHSSIRNFYCCLTISSLSFYLFSFQVHEKTILLATIPALLLFNEYPNAVSAFFNVSLFSMYPLCINDGIPEVLPLFVTYYFFLNYVSKQINQSGKSFIIQLFEVANVIVASIIYGLLLFVSPPVRYPHLFILFNAIFSFIHFCGFFIFLNIRLLVENYSIHDSFKRKKSN